MKGHHKQVIERQQTVILLLHALCYTESLATARRAYIVIHGVPIHEGTMIHLAIDAVHHDPDN